MNAGDLLQQVLGSHHAGGHDQIAGGRMPIAAGRPWHEAAAHVKTRLLERLGVTSTTGALDLVS
jgi:hypothetical protein